MRERKSQGARIWCLFVPIILLLAGCSAAETVTQLAPVVLSPISTRPATAVPTPTAAPAEADGQLERVLSSPAEFARSLNAAVAAGELDIFWQEIVALGRMPLIIDDHAVLMYRGEADTVEWRGDFSGWDRSAASLGARVGDSDLWLMIKRFPSDARLDYRIVLDNAHWMTDPLNPNRQLSSFGYSSELRMPDYLPPANVTARDDVAHGLLDREMLFDSRSLGYQVTYRVYTPADYDNLAALPVIYVTDGPEYAHQEMGALPVVLDNLIAAGQIDPLIAVFSSHNDPESGANRRGDELVPWSESDCPFCDFLVTELVPAIDASYRTDPAPDSRAILGASLGGLNAVYMGLTHPDQFRLIAAQSPCLVNQRWLLDAYRQAERLPLTFHVSQGVYDLDVENTRDLALVLREKGYPLTFVEVNDGHTWSNWRGQLEPILKLFFGDHDTQS